MTRRPQMRWMPFCAALACGVLATSAMAATPPAGMVTAKPDAATLMTVEQLDAATFAQWVDGVESPLPGNDRERLPQRVVWTDKTQPGITPAQFGDSRTPGVRHLRVGLKSPVRIGSVIVRGGGSLSVLKAGRSYPGKLDDETDWTLAERLQGNAIGRDEVGPDQFAVWTLPPGTSTRALRFTHVAAVTDSTYAGSLGGTWLMQERAVEVGRRASASTSAQGQDAERINDGRTSGEPWQSVNRDAPPEVSARRPVISATDPEWVTLTWPAAVRVDALNALTAGFGAADVQAYVGPADRHPRAAQADDWQTIGSFDDLKNGYAVQMWPNVLRLMKPVTTRAIRVRMIAPTSEQHPHLKGRTREGRNVWLGELMALQSMGDAPLSQFAKDAAPPPSRSEAAARPPIPVRFTLKEPGYVTLVVEDAEGRRVRNLVSETAFPAGANVAWWDGTDDLGRDVDAARHGLYRLPAQFVAPGRYRARGLTRGAVVPRYEFSVYATGNPPWDTADTTGGWLTNHSPPQAALFLPGDRAPGGKPLVYLGSYVAEGGAGLAWMDLDGRKQGGRGWVGGIWTGAPFLALDDGPKALSDAYAFVGSAWTLQGDKTKAELRITALTAKGDKPISKHVFPITDAAKIVEEMSGLAVRVGSPGTELEFAL